MARRLRIQYEGAIYHVINRGNYRRDVFATVGAAKAFEAALSEVCERHDWRLHAYVIMRNHYHLALETPQPNLVDGMHWLQSTFATRFNRMRSERGHLFQERYQSLLVEDATALVRVINYIHLNPVRARLVPSAQVALFRWSSLPRLLKPPHPSWLKSDDILAQLGLEKSRQGWARYVAYLVALADDPQEQERQEFDRMSRGWAIGTAAWRTAVARDNAHLALEVNMPGEEIRELKIANWSNCLDAALRAAGKDQAEITRDPKAARWKVKIAALLRRQAAAPHRWIAERLNMGSPETLRVQVCRFR